MDAVLSVVLGSLQTDMARLERIGMNLANVQTPGYKRDVLQAHAFPALLEAGASAWSMAVDKAAGTLRNTAQPLDLAIQGNGWFEVNTAQGLAYTRQGNFRLDSQGRIVTQAGDALMGSGGEIVVAGGAPRIDEQGRVQDSGSASSAPVGQVKVVQFDGGAALERAGNGLWRIANEAVPLREGAARVLQGHLENSNVSAMHEMVRLMEAMRHAEAMQKVAIGYDEMLATSIRRLGEGS